GDGIECQSRRTRRKQRLIALFKSLILNSTRIITSGGGTGGHIYPAIAIAHALKEMQPDVELLFVGALGKMEMEKVPKAGFPIVGIPVVGLQRSLSPANFLFPIRLLKSLRKAAQIIKDFQPQVAVGVGGFASGPLLQMASLKGIPTLIQEQKIGSASCRKER